MVDCRSLRLHFYFNLMSLLVTLVSFISATPGDPALGSFFIPHGLALDNKRHSLYVADRENGRVQVFNSITTSFIGQIKLPEFGGLVYAVDYNDNERKYLQS